MKSRIEYYISMKKFYVKDCRMNILFSNVKKAMAINLEPKPVKALLKFYSRTDCLISSVNPATCS